MSSHSSSGGSPGRVYPLCTQRLHKTPFILYTLFLLFIQNVSSHIHIDSVSFILEDYYFFIILQAIVQLREGQDRERDQLLNNIQSQINDIKNGQQQPGKHVYKVCSALVTEIEKNEGYFLVWGVY